MTSEELNNILNKSYSPVDVEKMEQMENIIRMYISAALSDNDMPLKLSAREMQIAAIIAIDNIFNVNKNLPNEVRGALVGFEITKYLDLLDSKGETIN